MGRRMGERLDIMGCSLIEMGADAIATGQTAILDRGKLPSAHGALGFPRIDTQLPAQNFIVR